MTLRRLIIRNLLHYWRTGVVVVFGLAIATAVIVGSLLVGDSVTGSLRDTATARLGNIDHALASPHFFRAQLASEVQAKLKGKAKVVPLVVLRGAAESASTEAVVPTVGVNGVGDAFWGLFPGRAPSLAGRECAINRDLARDLGVRTGDSILINVDKQGAVPSGTLFAHRAPNDTLRSLRLNVVSVLPDMGVGGFRLDVGTDTPRNVFLSRDWLTSEMDKAGKANAIVVESSESRELEKALASACVPADYGLKVVSNGLKGYHSLFSDGMLLDEHMVEAAREAAVEGRAYSALTSVYLAKSIRRADGSGPVIAYAVVAAVEPFSSAVAGPDEPSVWLSSWAAQDLGAHRGDQLELTYLVPLPDGSYRDAKVRLSLTGIMPIAGWTDDRNLVPPFEGITDAERIDEWNTPFPVDLDAITERDEVYWERYRTTPKVLVSLATARKMWQSGPAGARSPWVTSVRFAPQFGVGFEGSLLRVERALMRHLRPEDSGMVFRPIRQTALASAKGSTDFGQLFLAMSFFLVLAGAGLAAMLMRLSIERRAAETGIMLACGFAPSNAVFVLMCEGVLLSIAGTMLGLPLGILYAWGIIAALKSWWLGAVGSSPLWLHVSAGSLAVGVLSGILVGLASSGWSALRLRKTDALNLLAGWQGMRALPSPKTSKWGKYVLIFALAAAASALLAGGSAQMSFFAGGAASLVAGMSLANLALIRTMRSRMDVPSHAGLALRGAAANRGRSLLVIGLLACAAFVIITVAANTRDFSRADYTKRDSGSGGFALRAVSSSPIHYDLASTEGRDNLGFPPEDEKLFRNVRVVPFLMSSGEDISCLNLARSAYPRILAVSGEMVKRGGFSIKSEEAAPNPWTLLQATGRGIPVFGDASSVMWSLHSGLGKTCSMPGGDGAPVDITFAGLISQSIFAGELLMSEDNFRKTFPGVTEPRYFLIETPKRREAAVASALRRNLGRMGMEVKSTRELLNEYIGVQNTYLSMFLALGGLGVILGTFGMVAVLLRSALERRGEFALMLAQGFGRNDLARLLLLENAGLLLTGLVIGAGSALVAVAPALTDTDTKVNWPAIAVVFAGILAVGLVSCAMAARKAVRGPLMEALRGE